MGIREVQERVTERIEKVPGRCVDCTLKASRVAERGRQREIEYSVLSRAHRVCVCVCVCECVCVCLSVCACFLACVPATFCACVSMCGTSLYRPERPGLSFAFEFDLWTSFYNVFYIFT